MSARRRVNTAQLDRWRRSPEFREIALRALFLANLRRAQKPKCGAKRKSDGEPCRGLALANGRCRYHGGRTPSGDQWHRVQPSSNTGVERQERKVVDLVKRAGRRRRRQARMTPEELAAYEAWKATHQPGPAGPRANKRAARAAAAAFRKTVAELSVEPELTPGQVEIRAWRARSQALIDALEAEAAKRERGERPATFEPPDLFS